jgi:WD40 repeat protein
MKCDNTMAHAIFSPDGKKLLTVNTGRTACLWSVPNGELLLPPIKNHFDPHWAAYSPDNRFFATVQIDGLIRVWRLPQDNPRDHRTALTEDDGTETFVALSKDGRYVLPIGTTFWSSLLSTRTYDAETGLAAGPYLEAGGILAGGGRFLRMATML